MSWINFPGFRGGPAAVTHGHSHDHNVTTNDSHGSSHPSSTASTAAPNELDIRKNMIQCAELKKLNSRFYSEVLRKKFFVLYEDSRQSVTNPREQHNGENSDVSHINKCVQYARAVALLSRTRLRTHFNFSP